MTSTASTSTTEWTTQGRPSATRRAAVSARRAESGGIMYTVTDRDALRAAIAAAGLSHKRAAAVARVSSATIDHLVSGRQAGLYAAAAERLMRGLEAADVDGARALFAVPSYTPPED